jgi:hypothetical protein
LGERISVLEDAIPCIVHGGNRINEKLFMMILLEAWSSCMTNQEQITVENHIPSGVFGKPESRAQWKLPLSKEVELENVSFTALKVLDKLAEIA